MECPNVTCILDPEHTGRCVDSSEAQGLLAARDAEVANLLEQLRVVAHERDGEVASVAALRAEVASLAKKGG